MLRFRTLHLFLLLAAGSCASASIRSPSFPLAPEGGCEIHGSPLESRPSEQGTPHGSEPAFRNHLRISLGGRSLEDTTFWSPLEDQVAFGLEFARGEEGFGYEFALQSSGAEETVLLLGVPVDLRAEILEISGGVHYSQRLGDSPFLFQAGAGPSLVFARSEVQVPSTSTAASVDGATVGFYLHGGLDFRISRSLTLGVDLRFLETAGLDLESGTARVLGGDANYAQFTLNLGIHF